MTEENKDYTWEFGSSIPVKFLNLNVTTFDCEGNDIEIPKCEVCGNFKSHISGKDSFCWICTICMK